MGPDFDYHRAFARNLGWVTEAEQAILRAKRIAIAGLGGVGGSHVLALTRLGIGAFNIADFDTFDLPNFNRQAGASLRHLGRPKAEVLGELAADINPELDLRTFPEGVNRDNLDAFLDGVDLYVDSLDFFAVETRRMVFAACAEKGIPAITAAPLGMGAAFLAFMPGQMTFEEYFRMEGKPESEQLLRFLVGLSPAMLQLRYLAEKGRVNLDGHEGPSTAMACELCAGVAGANALKILLNRGDVVAAPWGLHFDAYRNRLKKTWRPWGNNNPVQRLMLLIARRTLSPSGTAAATETQARLDTPIERILDLARWAPSGDNEQPWRFEIVAEDHFVVHAHDTRDWCVYDLDGRASQIAVGALLETIAIAASAEGLEARFTRRVDAPEEKPLIDVYLQKAADPGAHKLLPFVKARVTQRRPFQHKTPDRSAEKGAGSVGWCRLPGDLDRRQPQALADGETAVPQRPYPPDHTRGVGGAPEEYRVGRAVQRGPVAGPGDRRRCGDAESDEVGAAALGACAADEPLLRGHVAAAPADGSAAGLPLRARTS